MRNHQFLERGSGILVKHHVLKEDHVSDRRSHPPPGKNERKSFSNFLDKNNSFILNSTFVTLSIRRCVEDKGVKEIWRLFYYEFPKKENERWQS
jgi:hypothetical protein